MPLKVNTSRQGFLYQFYLLKNRRGNAVPMARLQSKIHSGRLSSPPFYQIVRKGLNYMSRTFPFVGTSH